MVLVLLKAVLVRSQNQLYRSILENILTNNLYFFLQYKIPEPLPNLIPLHSWRIRSGKSYFAKAIGIKACNRYNVGYFHSEELLESMVALKEQDYDKYARKMKKYLKWELIILDDFLLHTITDEREIKILFELLEKRNEQRKSTICVRSTIQTTGKR